MVNLCKKMLFIVEDFVLFWISLDVSMDYMLMHFTSDSGCNLLGLIDFLSCRWVRYLFYVNLSNTSRRSVLGVAQHILYMFFRFLVSLCLNRRFLWILLFQLFHSSLG